MKVLYGVEEIALTNASGEVYTPEGRLADSTQYFFATMPISASKVYTQGKKVYVCIPVENVEFEGKAITKCFLGMTLTKFLQGIMVHTTRNEMTYMNLYYMKR